jgi:hypothetical protein
MDQLTQSNREWLDQRFAVSDGQYVAHQPIYGFGRGATEGTHLRRFCRTLNLFRSLLPLSPASILDVGGAEGYAMSLARHLTGADVVTVDLSRSACERACEFWGLRAAALDAADLPFADDAFDLVLCSEVVEHLSHPFHTIAELLRVARRYVLLTTEATFPWELHRHAYLLTRDPGEPHFDRNHWLPRDFLALFGPMCAIRPQFALAAVRATATDPERARSLVRSMAAPTVHTATTQGVIVVVEKQGASVPPPTSARDTEILDLLFDGPMNACPRQEDRWTDALVGRVRCPDCRTPPVLRSREQLFCQQCEREFGPVDGVLTLFSRASAPQRPDEAEAARRLTSDPGRLADLLDLVRRFETTNVSRSRPGYVFYLGLRWMLNQVRWSIVRAERWRRRAAP